MMSYIPNSAMPHARADNDAESRGFDWRPYADEAMRLARRGWAELRRHPREAAAGGAALVAGLAFATWRASRSRRSPFA
ncbi:MAG: hypothetical protein LC648_01400 [Novosphingobium sp.]|nr:hypothetical protein [Novosphingobium sp.]